MITIYVDINNAYTGTGHAGTELDPLSWQEFLDSIDAASVDTEYRVKGKRVLTSADGPDSPSIGCRQARYCTIDVTVTRWEDAPFIINAISGAPSVAFWVMTHLLPEPDEMTSDGIVHLTIEDLVFYSQGEPIYSDASVFVGVNNVDSSLTFKTVYFSYDKKFAFDTSSEDLWWTTNHAIKFNGCTFHSLDEPFYAFNYMYSRGYKAIDFNDCYFSFRIPSFVVERAYHIERIFYFIRCVFENESSDEVFLDEGSSSWPLSRANLDNCETGHSSPSPLPLGDVVSQEIFYYGNFGLSEVTDPSIIAIWVAGGYDTGLYNETRLGYGAFCFLYSFVAYIYLVQRTNKHVIKRLNSNIVPSVYDGHVFGTYEVPGSLTTQLNNPNGITINSLTNDIYICDTNNLRIIRLDKNLNFISNYTTIYKPYHIMFDNEFLFVIGIYDGSYIRIEQLTINLSRVVISSNMIGLNNKPTAIIPGFTAESIFVTGIDNAIYETSKLDFPAFTTRLIHGESLKRYIGAIYHSNGYLYLNDGNRIIKVNSSFVKVASSNKISRVSRSLKERLDGSILVYNVNAQTILRYDEDLNYIETEFATTGNTIDLNAYDVVDIIEVRI